MPTSAARAQTAQTLDFRWPSSLACSHWRGVVQDICHAFASAAVQRARADASGNDSPQRATRRGKRFPLRGAASPRASEQRRGFEALARLLLWRSAAVRRERVNDDGIDSGCP